MAADGFEPIKRALAVQTLTPVFVPLQSKALRERWLLDGAPAEEETQRRLQEDEVKTKLLEQVILRSASQTHLHLP